MSADDVKAIFGDPTVVRKNPDNPNEMYWDYIHTSAEIAAKGRTNGIVIYIVDGVVQEAQPIVETGR